MVATVFEMYKAQAAVLVPIFKALEKEMGSEKAQRFLSDAIGGAFREFGCQAYAETEEGNEGHFGNQAFSILQMFSEEGALEYEIHEQSDDRLKFNITRCKYAELYKSIDAPELGFLFVCNQDYPFQDAMRDDLVMNRPQTIMEGFSHCKFNWHVAKDVEEAREKREREETDVRERQKKIQKP
jgi:hypothetical protein